ncbi:hypothetical protein [Corynebacterium phocae]|uniref:hypothetical protein n=1 Tax=Corynebacterium phocae TaxID=161895 RepID=UPI0009528143|nr:hypothetical protein [Corynebacterium phocae]KAA8727943.1 hypothetical protein F4V58_01220 [Corynebacterium phocae]
MTDTTTRPQTVHLMLTAWLAAAGGEVLHQVLQIVISLFNRDALIAGIKTSFEDSSNPLLASDALLEVTASMAIFGSALLSMAVVGLLMFMLTKLATQHKWAGSARRLWFAFSIYFGLRLFFVFSAVPGGSKAPEWLIVGDGMVQILVGVTAVMGLLFSMKEEVLDYTGELAQIRKMEKELAEEKRRKMLEKNDDSADDTPWYKRRGQDHSRGRGQDHSRGRDKDQDQDQK